MVLSTHILAEVEAICRRVILIHGGRKVLDGSLAELTQGGQRLEDVFTRVTLGADREPRRRRRREAHRARSRGASCARSSSRRSPTWCSSLFAVIAGFLFFTSVLAFDAQIVEVQQLQLFDYLAKINLNDHLLGPFYSVIWVVMLFLIPGVTMGLFANEKAQGTQELLFTSPITIWELVLGKYLAAAVFVTLLVAIVAAYTGVLFLYGDPELWKSLAGLLGLLLVGLAYAAVGAFASSVTKNQLIAFFLALVLLFILWLLSVVADLGAAGGAMGSESAAVGPHALALLGGPLRAAREGPRRHARPRLLRRS